VQLESLPDREIETFSSTLLGQFSSDGGNTYNPFSINNVQVQVVTLGKTPSNETGTFPTEMTALNLALGPIMIRESPTLASTGQVTIAPIGGGMYHIDSFFDIFTEISLDGGATWDPSAGPTHVTLAPVPEPASLVLVGLGLVPAALAARRRLRARAA
jgi:hypothetical protein